VTERPDHQHTLALLLALTGTSAFSLQFFVPAMPDLVTIFKTTPATVQLTLTLFMLTYGLFQAVYGPLSDRFGRKPVLLVAIVIYVAGSFLGAAALSIEMVIAARVLQAVGAAAGFVLVPAIARDVYGHAGAPRAMSYISMTNGFISAAGPLIGGLIHQYAGWRYGLLATGTLGTVMLVMTALYLKESGSVVRQRVALMPILRGYLKLARTRGFMGYVLAVAPERPGCGAHRHHACHLDRHVVHDSGGGRPFGGFAIRPSECDRAFDCERVYGVWQRPSLALVYRRSCQRRSQTIGDSLGLDGG